MEIATETKQKIVDTVKKMQEIIHDGDYANRGNALAALGEEVDIFTIDQLPGLDEGMELTYKGQSFYAEDESSMTADINPEEEDCVEAFGKQYELRRIEDVLGKDIQLTKQQKGEIAKIIAEAEAHVFHSIQYELYENLHAAIEEKITELFKGIEGAEYGTWDEVTICFTVDGHSCSIFAWQGSHISVTKGDEHCEIDLGEKDADTRGEDSVQA